MVDIHGQSEHLSLLQVRSHLHLLDSFADLAPELADYRQTYTLLMEVRQQLATLRLSEQDAARRTDMLTFQIQEIDAAKLKADEEDELRQERTRLANAESLASHVQNALSLIEDDNPEVRGISELLGEVTASLQSLARIDSSTAAYLETAETSLAALQDLALELQTTLRISNSTPAPSIGSRSGLTSSIT